MTEEENKQLGKLIFEVAKNNKDLLVDIYDKIGRASCRERV